MREGTFFVTTPIYYVNDVPHIGHVYTTVAADAAARYHRSAGRRVFFLTGVDEHGQKVEQAARARGLTPQAHCDEMVQRFTALWARLGVTNDDFIRTTEPRHKAVVREILTRLHEKGEIYKATYAGWYCVPDERFWTEKDVAGGMCPDCGREVARIEESNYFFRMGKYRDWLVDHIQASEGFILPESRRNEVLGFLRQPLGDLCISRPKSRLSWGIEIPFDRDYVTYVWFDALINYVTAPGYLADPERLAAFWPSAVHLIGKDILTTHSVYWPTMLKAMGMAPPRRVFAHGWWTIEGRKMSKSLGNVVDPHDLIGRYGGDALRYFLLREIPFGGDGDFSHSAMVGRINSDLANDLGNLVQRSLGMLDRYRRGVIPPPPPGPPGDLEKDLTVLAARTARELDRQMGELAFSKALIAVWEFIRAANKFVDSAAPWSLAKGGEAGKLDSVLYTLFEAIRQAAVMCAPFLPETGDRIFSQLGIGARRDLMTLASLSPWGGIPGGTATVKGPSLFPRIETLETSMTEPGKPASVSPPWPSDLSAVAPEGAKPDLSAEALAKAEGLISFEDFGKVRLVSGLVLEAERVPKSRKLVRLIVDTGERRQIVAGIGEAYAPEQLVGKRIAVVGNLKPAKLMGVESQGMLLAATDDTGIHLVTFDAEVRPGARIK